MKNLLTVFFLFFSIIAFGQTLDTAAVRVEVDSLIKQHAGFLKKQDLNSAMLLLDQAEEKCLSAFGEETDLYAGIMDKKGIIHYFKGEYSTVESFFLKGKSIRENTLGKEHAHYAGSLNNLAILYNATGQFELSERLYIEGMLIREKTIGKEHTDYASSLNNLGILYTKMGQYAKAEPLYMDAMVIRKKELGEEHTDYASCLNNLGILYMYMGQNERGVPLMLEAKEIRGKVLGKEHSKYASTIENLAILYDNMEEFEKAEELYQEANTITAKVLGKEHPKYAGSLHNLANLYVSMGQYEKAEPLYLEAKTIRENSVGKEHPDFAKNLSSLASLYIKMGLFDKAEPMYVGAREINEKVLGRNHPDYAGDLISLATLYFSQRKMEEAEPLFEEANQIERKLLISATHHLSESELLIYMNKFIHRQDRLLSFVTYDSALTESVYDNTLFHKGFLLNANQQVTRLAHTDSTSTELYYQIKGINRRLASQYSMPIARRDSITIAELEEQANALEKELTQSVAGFGEALKQVKWQEVQEQLEEGAIALEFVHWNFSTPEPTDSVMYAALVLKNSGPPEIIPLFEERTLDSLFATHSERRSDYVNDLYSIQDRGAAVMSETKKTLYEVIWKPLEPTLEGTTKIYYAPSGLLHRINLDAIPYDDEMTIGDRFNTVQLNSTRSLVLNQEDSTFNNRAVLYGGIQYEADSATLAAAMENQLDEALASRGEFNIDSADTTLRSGSWNYLKWTKREAESIHDNLKENEFNSTLYSDHDATEESFRSLGQVDESPRILHIATHGFFFPEPDNEPSQSDKESVFRTSDNPMIRSGLILSGGNYAWQGNSTIGNMEDGILTAYEISQMNLSSTELVVLSACETGLGDIEGNEGVYGLQRAFKIAGVKYLIMSLWQVPDRQTKEFMVTFYQHWLEDKMTIPEAFQKTQQEMKERFFDPYNWAGFVLVE